MSVVFSKSHRSAWLFLSGARELIHQENAKSYHRCTASRKIKCMELLKGGKKRRKLRPRAQPPLFHGCTTSSRLPELCALPFPAQDCTVSQRFAKCSGGQGQLTGGIEFQLLTARGWWLLISLSSETGRGK